MSPRGTCFSSPLFRTGPQDHQKPHPLTIDYVDATRHRQVLAEDSIVFNVSIEGGGKPLSIPVQVLIAQ